MSANVFDLDAGALGLDFANTVDWHASDHPHDKLTGFADLLTWAQAAETVSPEQVAALRQRAQNQPEKAHAAFERALQLREAIYRIFAALSRQEDADPNDLAVLNRALRSALAHMQVATTTNGFAWEWVESTDDFDQILWPVARSAGELLVSGRLDRIRQCADDRGCGYLFVDTSRNASRRWCSMESCGNRAKAHRHYKRKRQEQ